MYKRPESKRNPTRKLLEFSAAGASLIVFIYAVVSLELGEKFDAALRSYFGVGSEPVLLVMTALFFAFIFYFSNKYFKLAADLRGNQRRLAKALAEKTYEADLNSPKISFDGLKIQEVLDGAPDLIIQVNEDFRIVWANNHAKENYHGIVGDSCHSVIWERSEPCESCYCKKAMQTGKVEKVIKKQPLGGGGTVEYWECIAAPMRDKDTGSVGAILFLRNISDRIRFQEANNLLASIIESSEEAIIGATVGKEIISWNAGAKKMLGYEFHEALGKPVSLLSIAGSESIINDAFEKVKRDSMIYRFKTLLEDKRGGLIRASTSMSPVKNSSGEVIGVSLICRDITGEAVAEEALRESERRLRQMAETIQDSFWLYDWIEKRTLFVSPAYEKIWGRPVANLENDRFDWLNAVCESDVERLRDSLNKIEENDGFDETFRIVRADGSVRWLQNRAFTIRDSFGKLYRVAGVVQDITEQKAAEEELKESREKMRKLARHLESVREEEKKRVAFEIHDELGFALTALKFDAQWIGKKFGDNEKLLEKTKDMAEQIVGINRKIREISTQLRPSSLDHFGLVAAAEQQVEEFQKRTSIRCKLRVEPEDISIGEKTSTAVFRILQEALTNVARHSKATRADVSLIKTDESIILEVKDNGVGIPPDAIVGDKSFGLLGMRERASGIEGVLTIDNNEEAGALIKLVAPI